MARNELSWSLSKARIFEECPRRYYYQYYFSHVGYAPDAPEEAKLALEMRRIKGLDMWVGEVVHQTIQWVLEQTQLGNRPTKQDAIGETRRLLSEGWRCSKLQLWRQHPDDHHPNLFEHYYGVEVGQAATDRLKNKAFTSTGNFMESEVLERITSASCDCWLPIEKFTSFRMEGILFFLKFDFALKDEMKLTVYDWKTGKPSREESRQLACYALYTSSKWGVPVQNVKVCAVHLQPELDACERCVEEADIEEARAFVKQSFNAMVKCLHNPVRNIAVMEDFPMSGNLLRCGRCNFKGICEQGAFAQAEEFPPVEDLEEA